MTTLAAPRPTTERTTPKVGRAAAALGVSAAALCLVLSLISLALAPFAVVAGIVSLRRGERPFLAGVAITAGLVSAYLIVLEMTLLGA